MQPFIVLESPRPLLFSKMILKVTLTLLSDAQGQDLIAYIEGI